MIHLGCLSPSSDPTSTCVARASPLLNTGTRITVENFEEISACRLIATRPRNCLASQPGLAVIQQQTPSYGYISSSNLAFERRKSKTGSIFR